MSISKRIELPKIFFFYGSMATIALLWITVMRLPVTFFGFKGLPEAYMIAFLIFIFSTGLSVKSAWAKKLEELFASLLTPIPLPAIFILALLSSVGEELFFRGALLNQFGVVISSLLFGFVHVPIYRSMIPWTIMATVMGFVLGGLYLYSGNLLAPIMLHFLINFLNIWAINQKYSYTT